MGKISSVLRFHLKIFEIIGYTALPRTSQNKCFMLWSCLLMALYNAAAFTALFSNEDFLFTEDKFGWFNDILKVVFCNIAVTTSYMESILKQRHLTEFWCNYCELQADRNIRKLPWLKDFYNNRRFLVIFYGIVGCEFLVAIVFINIKIMTHHLVLFWSVFTPFIFATHMRNMQFIFFIELIRLELLKLKQDLSLMVDYTRFHAYGTGFKGFEKFLRSKILEKQKDYHKIYKMYGSFQNAFGFSIVTVLLMIYVRVVVDAYFNYYMIYRCWNNAEIIMLVPACMHIPIFLIVSKNCMDVVQYITLNLHSIISQFDNKSNIINVQLQNFSLQILHENICINGIGLQRMDGYMLAKVVGSITTYMIFFIQFMPKFSNTMNQ